MERNVKYARVSNSFSQLCKAQTTISLSSSPSAQATRVTSDDLCLLVGFVHTHYCQHSNKQINACMCTIVGGILWFFGWRLFRTYICHVVWRLYVWIYFVPLQNPIAHVKRSLFQHIFKFYVQCSYIYKRMDELKERYMYICWWSKAVAIDWLLINEFRPRLKFNHLLNRSCSKRMITLNKEFSK